MSLTETVCRAALDLLDRFAHSRARSSGPFLRGAGSRVDEVSSSAAGPKPGRDSFTPKLGGLRSRSRLAFVSNRFEFGDGFKVLGPACSPLGHD